ncbi:hypothetical protein JCM21900_003137 [Sporobolomyces salmonicolor]
MLRAATLSLFAAGVLVASVSAQTAADIETELSTLSTVIPDVCNTDCTTWLDAYRLCGTDSTAAAFSPCICDATFQSDFATCASCMSTELTTEGDTTDAATATQAPIDLTNYCATASTAVSSTTASSTTASSTTASSTTTSSTTTSSTTTSSTTTSSTTTSATSTTTTTPATTPTTDSSSSSSTSTTDSVSSTTTSSTQSTADQDFPTQTKSASVFANAGAKVEGKVVAVAAGLLGAVAGAMMML